MPVRRFDVTPLQAPERLDNGFVRTGARLTRSGVFTYVQPDGTVRREFRPPDEVFHADSLHSFEHAPVTDDHPPEMLDAGNARMYSRGHLGDSVRRDGEFVKASMLVTDEALIAKMVEGKTQVSCGYHCDLDETPGEWHGQKYDVVQRNIRGNHVAIVDVGRAGPSCAARMDGAFTMIEESMPKKKKKDNFTEGFTEGNGTPNRDDEEPDDPSRVSAPSPKPATVNDPDPALAGLEETGSGEGAPAKPAMKPVTVNSPALSPGGIKGVAAGAATLSKPQHAATVTTPNQQTGGLQASRGDKRDMTKITIDGKDYEVAPEVANHVAGLQARHDAAVQARTDAEDPAKLSKRISARVALEKGASAILGEGARMDEMSDREVKEAVLKELGVAMPEKPHAAYVDARYDAALEYAGKSALQSFRADAEHAAGEGARIDSDQVRRDARAKMHGLQPLPADAVTKSSFRTKEGK